MNTAPVDAHRLEMRDAYYDGAPGILVSGLVWLTAAAVCFQIGVSKAVWTLLIGGALIHPLSLVVTKLLGRSASTAKGNPHNMLAAASTVWLIVCCAMAYGLFLLKPTLFFPAMMATIGCRYMVFASIYARPVYWVLGAVLVAGANAVLFLGVSPAVAAGMGGLIEVVFACVVFSKAERRAAAK